MQSNDTKPRAFAIITISAVVSFYLLYLASAMAQMIAMHSASHAQVMTPVQELPQSDFGIFWYVGKLLALKLANTLGFHASPSPWLATKFHVDILSATPPPAPAWPYPPTMGLLVMVFSLIPLAPSFWIWRIFCLAVAAFLLRKAGLSWLVIIAGLLSPAELHDAIAGQNGALTAGLLISALLLFDKKPRLGGVIAGLLCIKPQIGIALPAILLSRSRAKALAACLAVAAFLILLSVLLEGWQFWVWFFTVARPQSMRIVQAPFSEKFPAAGFTVFLMARGFHAGLATAWILQGISSVAALCLVQRAWARTGSDAVARTAFTVCASLLITPYGYSYDLVAFSIAIAALFLQAPSNIKPVLAVLWLFGGYTITFANLTGWLVMPLAAVFGAMIAWRQLDSDLEGAAH